MMVKQSCCFLLLFLTVASTSPWAAAAVPWEPSRDSLGNGMHAYFGGNSTEAESLFSQAIRDYPSDPRPHYFLGLSLLHQGRSDEARSEMTIGATLEAQSPGSFAVGKSLERVQGGDRLMLEEYRRQARADRAIVRNKLKRTLYRPTVATFADNRVLRQKVSIPIDRFVQPVSLAEWSHAAVETPPSTAAPTIEAPAPVVATDSAPSTVVDPFADDPAPQPEGKIPSGKLMGIVGRALLESAPMPSLEGMREHLPGIPMPAGLQPQAPAGDAFGADPSFAPAAADPFGEPAVVPSHEENPEESSDSPREDPFGEF